MIFLIVKLVHILSATFLFGAGAGSAYALMRAHRTGDLNVIQTTLKQIIHADWIFTALAGVVQLATGLIMVWLVRYPILSGWVFVSLILFVVAIACWIPAAMLQYRMLAAVTHALAHGLSASREYGRHFFIWAMLGIPAFFSMLGIFYLMVFRPSF
jgi:uncharacterized membrane protein